METHSRLPSRPREFVDLRSDDEDEEEDDAGLVDVGEPPAPGHFPELDNLLLDNLVHDHQAVWDAGDFEAHGIPVPILGDWQNEFPLLGAEGLPQMFRQAERLNLDPLPVNPVNDQANNGQLDNANKLTQEEVNNLLNNDLLNENDLIIAEIAELNNRFGNDQMDNDDNFVWTQVNRERHNENNAIDRDSPPADEMVNKARCLEGVVDVFPDICLDFIDQLYTEFQGRKTVPALVELVLQEQENGVPYPKINQLKRKRPVESDEDDDEQIMRKYTADRQHNTEKYVSLARMMLSEEFASIPMSTIMKHFYDSGMVIYTTYQSIAEEERLWDPNNPSYQKLKRARRAECFLPHFVEEKLADPEFPPDQKRAYAELKDVRIGRAKWEAKLVAKRQREADEAAAKKKYEDGEAANLELAMKEGTMEDCGCCYDEFPRNRMVHCNNDSIPHFFCKRCARLHAETQIGSAKYELQCMSTDVCEAGYSVSQRQIFLDSNLTTALDRIEAETVLRLAGIENLASCPFCSYAAEYPPIEHERLFHCQRDSCAITSCRLCQKESHIPKTCQENSKDIGLDVRREVEEAMTAALVRLCNKCKGPFIKEDGCNKMNCPCGNIQCYVCSKSCHYNHFDDERRGGKTGNCPLFDDVNQRHEDETKHAEQVIVEKLRKEHPELAPEDLEIRVSDAVKADEEKRRKKRWHPHEPFRFQLHGGNGGQNLPAPPQIEFRVGDPERQFYGDAFAAQIAQQRVDRDNRANQAHNLGQGPQQPPNIQGAAVPVNPPALADRPHRHRHRHRNPARQALLDAAHARILANGQARIDAALAEDAGRGELRDRLAVGRKEARREIRELVREKIAADGAKEGARQIEAGADAQPRRGEDGDAEVIYRPGDAVEARRRVQGWVFEPFGPPPADGGAGEEAGAAAAMPATAPRDVIAHRRPHKDFLLRPHPRPPPALPLFPPPPPAIPWQPLPGMEEVFMRPLDDYSEHEPLPGVLGPMEDPMAFLNLLEDGMPPPIRRRRASEVREARRLARALGSDGGLEKTKGVGGVGADEEDGEAGYKQDGEAGDKQQVGRKEGERGLDFLMRLRRGRSKGDKKAKGVEIK